MKRYLVTGGAGFIGGHLIKNLKKKGNKIIVLDLKKKILENKNKLKGCELVMGDISNEKTFDKIKGKFETVFHLAAKTSTAVGQIKSKECIKTNVSGTKNLYKWAIKNKPKKIVFTSSMAVYGKIAKNVKEKRKLSPISVYGQTKKNGEKILSNLKNKKIQVIILRLFNVYGPGQDYLNLKQGMLSIYLYQIFKNKYVKITGSLDRSRDLIFINDVISAMTLRFPQKKNFVANVGTGKPIKVINLIKKIFTALKINFRRDRILQTKEHKGDTFASYANIRLLKSLRWSPKFDLNTGLRQTVEDLKKF